MLETLECEPQTAWAKTERSLASACSLCMLKLISPFQVQKGTGLCNMEPGH